MPNEAARKRLARGLLALGGTAALAWAAAVPAHADRDQGKKKDSRASAGREAASAALLGPGEPVALAGAREPSGVAFHPGLRWLFVVGDEGSLVELDLAGRQLRSAMVGGNRRRGRA